MKVSVNLCACSTAWLHQFSVTQSCYEAFIFYSNIVSGEGEDAFWHALGHVICVTDELSNARLDDPHPR